MGDDLDDLDVLALMKANLDWDAETLRRQFMSRFFVDEQPTPKPKLKPIPKWNIYDHINATYVPMKLAIRIDRLSEPDQRRLVEILRERNSKCLRTN